MLPQVVKGFSFGSEVHVVINTSEKSFNNFFAEPDAEFSYVETDFGVNEGNIFISISTMVHGQNIEPDAKYI